MISAHTLSRRVALVALPALVGLAAAPVHGAVLTSSPRGAMPAASIRAAVTASPTVAVKGRKTTWQVSLLGIRSMYRIPGTSWVGYKSNFYRFFVLTLRLTNTGDRTLAPADDLVLALKVSPPSIPHQAGYAAGFTILDRTDKVLVGMMRTAARTYGGAVPWTAARPGQSTTYCYVIGTNRGDSHYGLYNILPRKEGGTTYLLDTGM